MAVQKKQSAIPPSQGPLSTRTIKSQRKTNTLERGKENGVNVKAKPQKAQKAVCPVYKTDHGNTGNPRAITGQNGLNVDERLKAARERRKEQQKISASRELDRLEREQKARRYYEQQLQERKKKLLEQRLKEERRRAAVEEKRKQRIKEETERYKSALRKTLEKSQRAQQNSQNRGRKLTKTNVSFHSSTTSTPHKPPPQSGPVQHKPSAVPSPKKVHTRSITVAEVKAAKLEHTNRKNRYIGSNGRSPAVKPTAKPASAKDSRTASLSPERSPRKSIRRHSTPLQPELPSVPEEDVPSPGNTRPDRASAEGQQQKIGDGNPPEAPRSNLPSITETQVINNTSADGSPLQVPPCPAPQPPEITYKPSAGTTDPGEASRVLAEKRKEARLQREREEQQRLQREEAERKSREELERKRAEERAHQQAEAQRLIEEKRRREEEEQRRANEERAQALREAQLLLKQREEEQARERAKAEQLKQDRELLAQKEEAERQARKKRLEEIMRRTRRTDSPDTKSEAVRISVDTQPKENTQPVHNGTIKDAMKLPIVTKPSQLGLNDDDDVVPVVAFKERRSLRTLTGLEEIQTQHRAEVI